MFGPLTLSLAGIALDIVGAFVLTWSLLGFIGALWLKARLEANLIYAPDAEAVLRRRSEGWVDGMFGFGTLLLGFVLQFVALMLASLGVGSDLSGPGEVWPSVGLAVLAAAVALGLWCTSRDELVPVVARSAVAIEGRRAFRTKQTNLARQGVDWPP